MERIYHRFEVWEDFKNGFFGSPNGEKKEMIQKVVELFSNSKDTEKFMNLVISTWQNSCEHNLSNIALNRVAYLGQSACCIYAGVPYRVTMEAWSSVPKEHQDKANEIAETIISEYEKTLKSKQLCLKFI